MGAWGTSLYANDSASDIRGDYVDGLRRGKTNEAVTQELIDKNHDIMGDVEEEPLFWFALADTQWNYVRVGNAPAPCYKRTPETKLWCP